LIAVYEEQEAQQRGATSPGNSSHEVTNINTNSGGAPRQPSPEPYDAELVCFQPIRGGEIEVNSSALKASMFPTVHAQSGVIFLMPSRPT
ncbi:partitioning defective 3 homolog B isoform X1, partial [Tachysurus ichikawai]